MKLTYPAISRVFDTEDEKINTLVIEHPRLLAALLTDLTTQIAGGEGRCVVSQENKVLPIAKTVELLDRFIPFEAYSRSLRQKINAFLEETALGETYYAKTAALLGEWERLLSEIALELPGEIAFSKITAESLVKAAGAEVQIDGTSLPEMLLDYMELVTTLEREKLFVLVDLRRVCDDEETKLLLDSALSHGYHILMIESSDRPRLPNERRWIVDRDLCEIG